MSLRWPDRPEIREDALVRAGLILDAVNGDWAEAQANVLAMAEAEQFTVGMAHRLLWLLTPHGEA